MKRRALLGAGAAAIAAAAVRGLPLGATLAGCQRASTPPVDRGKALADVTALVIVPTYEEAVVEATALEAAAKALAATPDAPSLAAAQEAWRRARAPWKRADAFLFGPADDLAVTGGVIDSGPPDEAKLLALVAAATPLDAAAVGSLGGNQRGFAGLEWLWFDPEGGDAAVLAALAGATGERRRTLGALAAADLRAKIEAVRDAWRGGYANELAQAGRGSGAYPSERQGVDAVVNALIAAAEIVIALRLAKPLGLDRIPPEPHPELVESGRADTSLAEILHVLDGIEATYTSTLGGAKGTSLSDAVREFQPGADDALRRDLAGAKAALAAVTIPLRRAVAEQRDLAIAAHAACREVKRRLATEIAGALGTSVGFNVTDGD